MPQVNRDPHASQVRSRPPVVTASRIFRTRLTALQSVRANFGRIFRLRLLDSQSGYAPLVSIEYFNNQTANVQSYPCRRNFSVFVDCSSNNELEKLFTALSQDGKVTVPPSDMPSGRFGMCDDSFGTSWILNCATAG